MLLQEKKITESIKNGWQWLHTKGVDLEMNVIGGEEGGDGKCHGFPYL